MSRCACRLLSVVLLAWASATPAGTYRVDDSASVVEASSVRMKWEQSAPGGGNSQVAGALRVRARLDVAPWQGHIGRIYLTLPASAAVPVSARWATRGRLLPGTLRSGERTLVYAGPVTAPVLEDTLDFVLQADGRELVRSERLEFGFEIEPEEP